MFMDQYKDFTVVSWNIHGALGRIAGWHVRDIVSLYHPSLFLIYETHGAFNTVEKLWPSLGYKLIFIQEARGHSRGIWVLSCKEDLVFSLIDSMFQAITFSVSKGNFSWFISAVYASPIFSVRCDLWNYLTSLRSRVNGPWVLLGDLNEVINSSEVFGGTFSPAHDVLLSNMMASCDFIDMDTIGGFYTWHKNVNNGVHIRKWFDRCMADIDWRLQFPHALVEVLAPYNLDHNPLLLSCNKSQSRKAKSFHFQAAWISHPEYEGLVENTWNNSAGNAMFKLQKIQDKSLIFNKEIFGNIFRKKKRGILRLG